MKTKGRALAVQWHLKEWGVKDAFIKSLKGDSMGILRMNSEILVLNYSVVLTTHNGRNMKTYSTNSRVLVAHILGGRHAFHEN